MSEFMRFIGGMVTGCIIFVTVFCLVGALFSLGMQLGISSANDYGPRAACEQLRFQVIKCDLLKETK